MVWHRIKHKRFITLLLISIFVLFFLSPEMQKRPIHFLMWPFIYVISTLQEGLMVVSQGMGGFWSGYIALTGVREENLRLREQLYRLQNQNIQLLETRSALERIESLLELKTQSGFPLIAARVIARDPTNWHQTMVIDKGSEDGIAVDMGVMVTAGVVGRVTKIRPGIAHILLLTDRNSAIPALIQRTRDEGIVEGAEGGLARLKFIPTLSELEEGDQVLTSGLIGSFPKGLLIGRIRKVEKKEMALFQQAEVIPEVDFSRLEEVMVIAVSQTNLSESDSVPR